MRMLVAKELRPSRTAVMNVLSRESNASVRLASDVEEVATVAPTDAEVR